MNKTTVQLLSLLVVTGFLCANVSGDDTPKQAQKAFQSFSGAGSPEELTKTITRRTAFELGTSLWVTEVMPVGRHLRRHSGTLVDGKTVKNVKKRFKKFAKKYNVKKLNETSTNKAFQMLKDRAYDYFLDVFGLAEYVSKTLGAPTQVDANNILKHIPAQEHWTFENISDTKVDVVLPGDRIQFGNRTIRMSAPPYVVKKNGDWNVHLTGVDFTGWKKYGVDHYRFTETYSTGKDVYDAFFDDATSLPATGSMKSELSGPLATRSGSAIVRLNGLGVESEDGKLKPESAHLQILVPPFPHLGRTRNMIRHHDAELELSEATNHQGKNIDLNSEDNASFEYRSRFVSPAGLGPVMEIERSLDIKADFTADQPVPAPEKLSGISGKLTFHFPILCQTSSVSVSSSNEKQSLTAGQVQMTVRKKSDKKFVLTYSRDHRDHILKTYGRTENGKVQALDTSDLEHGESGKRILTVETKKPIQEIVLVGGSSLYEKTIPFEFKFGVEHSDIPLENGASTNLGGTTFTIVKSHINNDEGETHVRLQQSGPLTDGKLAGIRSSGAKKSRCRSREGRVGFTTFYQYRCKPKKLNFFRLKK